MASYYHLKALESALSWHSKTIKTNVQTKLLPTYISYFQYILVTSTTQGQCCKAIYVTNKTKHGWFSCLFISTVKLWEPRNYLSLYSYNLLISYAFIQFSACFQFHWQVQSTGSWKLYSTTVALREQYSVTERVCSPLSRQHLQKRAWLLMLKLNMVADGHFPSQE